MPRLGYGDKTDLTPHKFGVASASPTVRSSPWWIDCLANRGTFVPTTVVYFTAFFQASFNSAANTTTNGCNFMCEGGSCIVRGGDALPAELMNFAIE